MLVVDQKRFPLVEGKGPDERQNRKKPARTPGQKRFLLMEELETA